MNIDNKFEIGQEVYYKNDVIKHIKEGSNLYPLTIEDIVVCGYRGLYKLEKPKICYRLRGGKEWGEWALVPATEDSINEINKELLKEEISKKKSELEELEKKLGELK